MVAEPVVEVAANGEKHTATVLVQRDAPEKSATSDIFSRR